MWGIAVFWACFPTAVFPGKSLAAPAFEVFLFQALSLTRARIWALTDTAVIAFKFRVAFTFIADAHSMTTARVGARWEFARFAGPHIVAQAYAVLALAVAIAVLWARFLAAVFAGPSFLAGTFKRFRVALSVGLGRALVGALLFFTPFAPPSWLAFAGTLDTFATRVTGIWAIWFRATFTRPPWCTVAFPAHTFSMLGAVHWAFLVFAPNASVFWLAHTTAVVHARSVVVAVLWAELKATVGISVSRITFALTVGAFPVVGALVRAGFYFACNTSPSAAAEARAVVAHTAAGTVARASFRCTVGAHPSFVAMAS